MRGGFGGGGFGGGFSERGGRGFRGGFRGGPGRDGPRGRGGRGRGGDPSVTPCTYFNSPMGCKRGEGSWYIHEKGSGPPAIASCVTDASSPPAGNGSEQSAPPQ